MNYLLDTCVVSDFFKKNPQIIRHFKRVLPQKIHLSSVMIMEIEYGLKLNPPREEKLRPLWDNLLESVQIVPFNYECACATAEVRSYLKSSGTPIGPYDLLLAGTALAHNFIMVTSNHKEFKRVVGLTIEDWRE